MRIVRITGTRSRGKQGIQWVDHVVTDLIDYVTATEAKILAEDGIGRGTCYEVIAVT
jgi:adenine-specific DNA glycosylase